MPHDYQAFFPAAICLYSTSSDSQSLTETSTNVVIDILWLVTEQYKGSYTLTVWLSPQWGDDTPPPFRYLSELLNDPSRAAEFLVTEKHFANFSFLCAGLAFGQMPYVVLNVPMII